MILIVCCLIVYKKYHIAMKNEILVQFGKRIRQLRHDKKLSQEKLAEITGFHRTYIGMIERGERNPSLVNIKRFADVFGLLLEELFRRKEDGMD